MISVVVGTVTETLDQTTDYHYSIKYTAGSNTINLGTASPYGVGYALESLAQLIAGGKCSGFTLNDHPTYEHRGLMVDTGRRFYPISFIKSLLDGMETVKMNVLHFHLSEECFRVESKVYPNITSQCTVGKNVDVEYYKQTEIAELVHGARFTSF
jgi:hexosaminidase